MGKFGMKSITGEMFLLLSGAAKTALDPMPGGEMDEAWMIETTL
jgi:hypothetical protein